MLNDNLSRYEEFANDQEKFKELENSLLSLVRDSVSVRNGETLKISAEAAFHTGLRDLAQATADRLTQDSKYKNVRINGATNYIIEADLVEPVAGIKKIEYHFNKDY